MPTSCRAVIARWRETGRPIVVARYAGIAATRCCSGAACSTRWALSGDVGARSLMERDATRVAFVDVDGDAPPDVDTPEDLAALDA